MTRTTKTTTYRRASPSRPEAAVEEKAERRREEAREGIDLWWYDR